MTDEHWDDPEWVMKRMNEAIGLINTARAGVERFPASRERSLALTKLDEAWMWLTQAATPYMSALMSDKEAE